MARNKNLHTTYREKIVPTVYKQHTRDARRDLHFWEITQIRVWLPIRST